MPLEPDEAAAQYYRYRVETETIRARLGLPETYIPLSVSYAFSDPADPGEWRWPDGTVQRALPMEVLEHARVRRSVRGVSYRHLYEPRRRVSAPGVAYDDSLGLRLVLEE